MFPCFRAEEQQVFSLRGIRSVFLTGESLEGKCCLLYTSQEGLLELYKKIRPGEPLAVDSAESLITSMFFDPRRYDLAKVGRRCV